MGEEGEPQKNGDSCFLFEKSYDHHVSPPFSCACVHIDELCTIRSLRVKFDCTMLDTLM